MYLCVFAERVGCGIVKDAMADCLFSLPVFSACLLLKQMVNFAFEEPVHSKNGMDAQQTPINPV